MRRRVQPRRVVWQRPAAKRLALTSLVGVRHRHGCATCSRVYEDTCPTPDTDHLCHTCRGHPPPVWETDLRPQECCLDSRPVTTAEQRTYLLAGENQWWLCPTCKRPHTHQPRRTDP